MHTEFLFGTKPINGIFCGDSRCFSVNGTKKRFLVVDGSSLAHRAFYALPLLSNRQGVFTNAVYGFLTMLLKILAEEQVDYIAVAFDKSRETFRTERYAEYKGHRKATPPELVPQFSLIKDVLKALRIASFELDNYEADDLIGTMAKKAEAQGMEVLVLTGDRDALQLVSPSIKVLLTRKGISQLELYDLEKIAAKYGVRPEQLIDVKGLMGDSSDNIPGVPGVGEKTALKLIQTYGSLENVLANLDNISGSKLRESLGQYAEQAVLSKELATINCQAPLAFCLEDCLHKKPDYPLLLQYYRELEFNSLIPGVLEEMRDAPEAASPPAREKEEQLQVLEGWEAFVARWHQAVSQHLVAVELELEGGSPRHSILRGIGFATAGGAWGYEIEAGRADEVVALLRDTARRFEPVFLFHDAKKAMLALGLTGFGELKLHGDTMLAAYLLNPNGGQKGLAEIVLEHLNLPLVEEKRTALSLAKKAQLVYRLQEVLRQKLAEAGMLDLYTQVELPLVAVLASMEARGVKLDLPQLEKMGRELEDSIEQMTRQIYELAGEEFNINSPKQLGRILFEKLGLPPVKKTKTGYSTDAEVLEELAPRHPIVASILQYRQLVKLHGTYVEGLKSLADPVTGKVHTTFNQTVTATGRLSSQEPNLQNIPIRLEQGRLIRKVFIPSQAGWLLLAADYSQIELRVLAHMSGDANLIDAFRKKQDIHARTASEVFGVPLEMVTPEMRRQAKAVNFGIVYGISDYGLSRDLGISRKEAARYIDLYFTRYPGVKKYIDDVIQRAREQGYVTTLLNRRRYLPDLFSSNRNVRAFGERTAMNTPIQGTAADIIKLAMIKIEEEFRARGLTAAMILQVHDELIFEVPEQELEVVAELVRDTMENVMTLQVPLEVDVKVGPNWYDMVAWERKRADA